MKTFVAALFILAAEPALALSCLRPDLARSYQDAASSDQTYSVVLGRFHFEPDAPPFDGTVAPSTPVPARFDGRVLGPGGFSRDVRRDVVLDVSCVSDTWCGNAGDPGERVLAFLRHDDDDLVLDIGPCPKWLFTDPADAQIQMLGDCFTGGTCR